MPEKVSSVLKTLSLCNCHNFIFSLSFCGILAFTLSCLSPSLFKPVPIALHSQSLNKFLMVSLVSWLSYFLLCYLIRLPNVFFVALSYSLFIASSLSLTFPQKVVLSFSNQSQNSRTSTWRFTWRLYAFIIVRSFPPKKQ